MRKTTNWYVYKIMPDDGLEGGKRPTILLMPPLPEAVRGMVVNQLIGDDEFVESVWPADRFFDMKIVVALY